MGRTPVSEDRRDAFSKPSPLRAASGDSSTRQQQDRPRLERVISLVPDAFGGRGGIALYNRYFLRAVSRHPSVQEVVVLPRKISYELEKLPDRLEYLTSAAHGRLSYAMATARQLTRVHGADLIICGHLHLLPIAKLLQARFRCPILPLTYGVEAWSPTRHVTANWLCHDLHGFIAIRHLTASLFLDWAKPHSSDYFYLPNCIDERAFGIAPKQPDLVERYGLRGRKVVMTAGRMDTAERERRKGFDEVLEAMPILAQRVPDITYLVMGDGGDRPRLEEKARSLGVRERVVFTGYVPETAKADHYRLADVFAMPGSGPKFDSYPFRFVFLEALACGVPVVGARLEHPSEAGDPDARALVTQVDPNDPAAIAAAIEAAIARSKEGINPTLGKFYYSSFERRVHSILDAVVSTK
jgi:phosphatidyl-myo-inositol dimannoside synthase